MTTALHAISPLKSVRPPRPAKKAKVIPKLTKAETRTVGQAIAAVAAGLIPLFAYSIAHIEVDARPWMWVFVVASLLYSAPTLADWCGDTWCKGKVKAWGFVAILEGVMVFSSIAWAGYLCLALLMVINCHSAWMLAGKKASR